MYWTLFILISIVPIIASMQVQGAFNKYSRVRTMNGCTGEEAARRVLVMNNVPMLSIKPVRGSMTDHYNPLNKEICLSQTVYGNNSIAAVSVAAHEAGHAVQDAKGYSFLRLRHKIYPVTNFASQLSIPMVMFGAIFSIGSLVSLGILFFAVTTAFSLITLPVEFNASKRALEALAGGGMLAPQEMVGAKKVLRAAALTYVAAAATSIMMLLRLVLIYGNRDD